ncbi:hypothetical protein N9H93_05695, partial [Rhizobiaceae bacterium]|nr:hypothetical protein [Rhizobiaceae bacterium]
IDYNARPTLVRNPQTGALPVPVDNASLAEDPNFPTDPEAARAARLGRKADATLREGGSPRDAELGDGTEVSVDAEGYYRSRSATVRSASEGRDLTPGQERRLAQANREALLAERKKTSGGIGQGPRRYLTQPPVEYRTPAESAAVGTPGEREKQERKGFERLLDQIKE